MNINDVIANKYVIKSQIGRGKFGTVYGGINKKNNDPIAIKTEDLRTNSKILKHETTVLKYLYDHGVREIPIVFWYGVTKNYTCLVMPLYDFSLQHCALNFPLDVAKINNFAIVLINIIESVHKSFIIHRDIKPQNFMIKNNEIFCIDFGFATFYVDEHNRHLSIKRHDNVLGTPKYVSHHIHNGHTPSRRDDLISIGYVIMFMMCRELPWDSLKNIDNTENLDEIHIGHPKNIQRKTFKNWSFLNDCSKNISINLNRYLEYCYNLDYHETPNYDLLRTLFSNLLTMSK